VLLQSVKEDVKLVLAWTAVCVSAWLSYKFIIGLLFFGSTTFTEFCLFFAPVLALPIALIALWQARLAAAIWATITLPFLAAQIYLRWPDIWSIRNNGTELSAFIFVQVLLLIAAFCDRRANSAPGALLLKRFFVHHVRHLLNVAAVVSF
jgi:hypothetical protein